jgi:hypothetical protein
VDRFEFSHGGQAGKLQRVVFVGLAFDVGPPPGVFVGRADERVEAVFHRQVIDPPRRSTGFHDNEVSLAVAKELREVLAFGGRRDKLATSSLGVKVAGDGVEFAEVQCENLHWISILVFGGWSECDRQPHAAPITGPSRQFNDE